MDVIIYIIIYIILENMKCTIYKTNTNIFEDRSLQIDSFILMYVVYNVHVHLQAQQRVIKSYRTS